MRGNKLARGGDPMKTRSQKRREKKEKLSKTKRVQRLKKRLGRIAGKKFAVQEDSHMTALMESYILRRKAERAEELRKKAAEEEAAGEAEALSSGKVRPRDGEEAEGPADSARARQKHVKGGLRGVPARTSPAPRGGRGGAPQRPKEASKKVQAVAAKDRYDDQKSKRVQTRSLY